MIIYYASDRKLIQMPFPGVVRERSKVVPEQAGKHVQQLLGKEEMWRRGTLRKEKDKRQGSEHDAAYTGRRQQVSWQGRVPGMNSECREITLDGSEMSR